ncbi:MAG: alpha/beta fold hydrolase [Chitinophagaceae bacterium]
MKLIQKLAVGYFRVNIKVLAFISSKWAAKKAFKLFCTPFSRSKIKTSVLFEKAEKLFLIAGSEKLVGYRWNHPQPKRFLILHGFQSSAKNFERFVQPMVRKGYEVIAFDAPAHGESAGKQINVLQYRSMIVDICNTYGPVHAFMAHSFGGLAISLALENIDHTNETKMVLIAPATETSTAIQSLYNTLRLNTETRLEFERLVFNAGGQPVAWYSIVRALKNIKASILWFQDENDDVTPIADVQPVIEANYSNIAFNITKGLGHRRIYHDTDVLNAVLAFL